MPDHRPQHAAGDARPTSCSLDVRTRPVDVVGEPRSASRATRTTRPSGSGRSLGVRLSTFAPCDSRRSTSSRGEAEWAEPLPHRQVEHLHRRARVSRGDANVQGTSALLAVRPRPWSGFFEQQFRFFDRLFMTGGVRVEDNNVFGTLDHRARLAGLRDQGVGHAAARQRRQRLPGADLQRPVLPGLLEPGPRSPRQSFSWDVGVDQKLWKDRIRLGADLLPQQVRQPDHVLRAARRRSRSRPRSTSAGRAARASSSSPRSTSCDNLVATLNYTYTDTENLTTGRPLPREPQHRWNARLTWEPIRRLSLFTRDPRRRPSSSSRSATCTTPGTRGSTWAGPGGSSSATAISRRSTSPTRIQNVLNEELRRGPRLPRAGHQRPGRAAGVVLVRRDDDDRGRRDRDRRARRWW